MLKNKNIIIALIVVIIAYVFLKILNIDLYLKNKITLIKNKNEVLFEFDYVAMQSLDDWNAVILNINYFSPENISYMGKIIIYNNLSYAIVAPSFKRDIILIEDAKKYLDKINGEEYEIERCFIVNPTKYYLSDKYKISKVKASRVSPYLNKKDLTYFIAKGYFTPEDKEFWEYLFSKGLKLRLIDSDFAESNFKKNKTDNLNYEDLKGYIKLTPRDVVKGYPEEFSIEIDCNTISLID
ncbi:hypothetical protein Dip518_000057 [Parelusimicrobium proximum]|uniref:hypothetical protein n=1 Tax=Parelusimicrobium proximum TaxID=3228953 RepID=UPI003D177145